MASVEARLRGRPIADRDELLEFINRELVPVVQQLRDELNRVSGNKQAIDEDYTALASDRMIVADCTSAEVEVTLPAAEDVDGKYFTLKKVDAVANDAKFTTTDLIDGSTTNALTSQYDKVTVYSDGSTYHTV